MKSARPFEIGLMPSRDLETSGDISGCENGLPALRQNGCFEVPSLNLLPEEEFVLGVSNKFLGGMLWRDTLKLRSIY